MSHRRWHLLSACAALALAAAAASAQGLPDISDVQTTPVALVADSVEYDERANTVTASGNVEVFQGLRTLTASRIVYDATTGRITAEGPIVLRDTSGSRVLADAATLDASLRDGIVQGARAIIGEAGGTLAAVEGQRVGGRYSVLSRVVYSSCEVCAESPTPLWQIRANRVVHDEQERMIHYEGAIFDVLGVPVAYLPFFSHPDPTVKRKSGFLAPTFLESSAYGFALQIPYFIELGPSRDATITAFPTTRDGGIVIGQYRQAFDSGRLQLDGSAGLLDTGRDNSTQWRGHLFGEGDFTLGAGTAEALMLGEGARAGFSLELVSDDTYLDRYDFSEKDRLETTAWIERYADNGYFTANATYFRSLREDEGDDEDLVVLPSFEGRRNVALGDGFGDLGFTASGSVLSRPAGRDVGRFSVGADWESEVILPIGIALRGFGEARMDAYYVDGDHAFDEDTVFRFHPQIGVEARYPMIADIMGTTHLFEPGAQFIVAPNGDNPDDIPNEDSLIVEFDDNSIFSRNRFPGYDRVETGTRLNVGVRYARVADDPFTLDASFGRVFRFTEDTAFSEGSGLFSQSSDFVASVSFGLAPWVDVTNSLRIDDDFEVRRSEIAGVFSYGRADLSASYVYLAADPVAGAVEDRSEFNAVASLDISDTWRVGGLVRQDLENDELVRVGGRLAYRSECTALEFFVGRDYPNREGEDAETLVSVRVQLFGLADERRSGRGACGRPVPQRF